jgi:hypothetical protein
MAAERAHAFAARTGQESRRDPAPGLIERLKVGEYAFSGDG